MALSPIFYVKKGLNFVDNWKKRLFCLLLAVLALIFLAACEEPNSSVSGPSNPTSAQSQPEKGQSGSGDSSGAGTSSTPAETPVPTAEPLKTFEGEITSASKSVLILAGGEGSCTVLLTDETEHTGAEYLNGNTAAVSYRESEQDAQGIRAVKVEVTQSEQRNTAEKLLAAMTLEEKVGQLFFVRYPDNAAAAVSQYQFGGYILFGRDFQGETTDGVRGKIQASQQNAKLPLLIGVDEEGGTVVRVSSNPNLADEPYWSPRALYNSGGMQSVSFVEQDKCTLLTSLGINVNFAPVCDISQNKDDFMYDRSLGQDAETTGEYIRTVVGIYRENQVGCVLKHFPGYGDNSDTHTGIAYDNRDYASFQQKDFLPFQAGIEAGAGCVLVSHNIVSCKDGDYPASLSQPWHQVLREELDFDGVIITDDLSMGAIRDYCDENAAAVQAVKAGNDLLCCTDYDIQIPAVISAVQNGEISEGRIDESVLRILNWKLELGLINHDITV